MDFAGNLGPIKTGKCDLTGSITWKKERADTMLYSQVPNAEMDVVLLVLKDNSQNAAAELLLYEIMPAPRSSIINSKRYRNSFIFFHNFLTSVQYFLKIYYNIF